MEPVKDHSSAPSSAQDLPSHNPSPSPSYTSPSYKNEKVKSKDHHIKRKDHHKAEKEKEKHKKKKGIDKNMIVRVGGGGMGMMNPMGWYDERGASPTATPPPSPLPPLHDAETPYPESNENGFGQIKGPPATSRASALGLSIINEKERRENGDEDPDQVFTDSPPPIEPTEYVYALSRFLDKAYC